jgi:hypothetical protein
MCWLHASRTSPSFGIQFPFIPHLPFGLSSCLFISGRYAVMHLNSTVRAAYSTHLTVLYFENAGMLRRVGLLRTDVSEERIVSITRVAKIGSLGTLAVTSNRSTRDGGVVPPKRRFLQEPHNVISQKTAFFTVATVKTSILTYHNPAGLCSGDVMCFLWGTKWVFASQKTLFIVTAVKTSNLTMHYRAGLCSRDVMCLLWGTNWGFISQKKSFFIVTAEKSHTLPIISFITVIRYGQENYLIQVSLIPGHSFKRSFTVCISKSN